MKTSPIENENSVAAAVNPSQATQSDIAVKQVRPMKKH
jgi:hypothetical protein